MRVAHYMGIGCALVAFLEVATTANAKCTLERIKPQGSTLQIGNTEITLGDNDDQNAPTDWIGPLRSGQCVFDLAIMEEPFVLANQTLLYVVTFSAKNREVSLINPATCSTEWTSETFFGKVDITPTHLRLGTKKIPLDADCVPIQDPRKTRTPPLRAGAIEAEADAKTYAASRNAAETPPNENAQQRSK